MASRLRPPVSRPSPIAAAFAAVVLAGPCARAHPTAAPGPSIAPSASVVPSTVATSATEDCPDARSFMESMHPDGIPPEPTTPAAECRFTEEVRCVMEFPTTAAWQMDPFAGCPRTIPRWSPDQVGALPAFSRRATRAERLRVAGGACGPTPSNGHCCYVQFTAGICL